MENTISVNEWQAMAAAIVIVLTVVFKFIMDLIKDRREREASADRLQVLKDIAISNQAIREGQLYQNGKLSAVVSVNEVHHQELIRSMSVSCRARSFPEPGKPEQQL